MKPNQDYISYLFVFLFAIGLRIFFLIQLDEPVLFYKYPFFAEKLAAGAGIGERLVDLSPFYLYLLTLLKYLFNISWPFVKFIQAFVGAVNSLLLYAAGSRAFRKEVGLLAALMYAAYGNLIVLESTLEPTVFVLFFNILAVIFLLAAKEKIASAIPGAPGPYLVYAGIFTGLSIITKPSFLLFVPLAVFWLWVHFKERFAFYKRLRLTLLYGFAALLMVLPVTLRNYIQFQDLILVTADAGKVFYHGNANGASALEGAAIPDEGFIDETAGEPDYAHVLFRKTASRKMGKKLLPSQASKFWVQQALSDIFQNPAAYFIRQGKKFFYFFNDYEMHFIASAYKEYKATLFYPFLRYGVMVSLGILGMILSLDRIKFRFLFYAVPLVYLVSGMVFLMQSRYRTPAAPYICLFAAHAVFSVIEMIRHKKIRRIFPAFLLLVLFFHVSHFAYRKEIISMDNWQEATKIYYQMEARPLFDQARFSAAIEAASRCIDRVPGFGPAYNLRGKAYALLHKTPEALEDFNRVIRLHPEMPEGYKNLGFLYLLQGKTDLAGKYLQKALELAPHDGKVKEVLSRL
ncbi:MAG: tetratricopeptide repeat protein [Desulfobacterales bacterium]|nr:tetratricopeptide repeat protein [Desulfobacterales bacterium]